MLPTVGNVCDSATRTVSSPRSRSLRYCLPDDTEAPRSAMVVKPVWL